MKQLEGRCRGTAFVRGRSPSRMQPDKAHTPRMAAIVPAIRMDVNVKQSWCMALLRARWRKCFRMCWSISLSNSESCCA